MDDPASGVILLLYDKHLIHKFFRHLISTHPCLTHDISLQLVRVLQN